MLVGEIRDQETANIAIESALTGHLVLSTLHTNNAPASVSRLIEMGVEPFLVGSALDAVLAQRLARRLCNHCKEPYTPTAEALQEANFPMDGIDGLPTLHRPTGCKHCSNTGYRGRLAVHELMTVNEEIELLTVERAATEQLTKAAIANGMRTLREDGMAKVVLGLTSMEEIMRVII
jgi:type IV pilus assembly protein PilB